MQFHKREIPKGKYGEISKIKEEVEEALDSQEQNLRLMTLLELSDIIGAVDGVLNKHFPGFTVEELLAFAKLRGQVSVAQGWASE